jgi:hypothetical protein
MTMKQKTYIFPSNEGKTITKTLAPPTNERTVKFLQSFGKSSFSELLTGGGQLNYGTFLLDLAVNLEQLAKVLDICLVEGSEGIDFASLDMRISDEAVQDFFEQRGKKFIERLPASMARPQV